MQRTRTAGAGTLGRHLETEARQAGEIWETSNVGHLLFRVQGDHDGS